MLRGFAAAAYIVVTFPVVGLCKNHSATAGGTADNTRDPILAAAQGTAMVLVHCLELGNAVLGGVPDVAIHKRLMLSVHHQNIGIIVVSAGTSGRVPAQLSYIHGIAEYVFHGAVIKGGAAMGFDAHIIEPTGDGKETLSGEKAAEHLPDIGGLRLQGDKNAVLSGVAKGWGRLQLTPAVLFLILLNRRCC